MIKIFEVDLMYRGKREDIPEKYKAVVAMLDAATPVAFNEEITKSVEDVGHAWYWVDEPDVVDYQISREWGYANDV